MSDKKHPLISDTDIRTFFFETFKEALKRNDLPISPESELYTLDLLVKFHDRRNVQEAFSFFGEEPLIFALQRATEGNCINARDFGTLKGIGDFTLMLVGFWWMNPRKQARLESDYYRRLGITAYAFAAKYSEASRDTFLEMARNFYYLADVLMDVSIELEMIESSDKNIVKLIEEWHKTHGRKIKRILDELGIDPTTIPASISDKLH